MDNEKVIHKFVVWALISLSMLIGLCLYFRISVKSDWLPFLGLAALTALNVLSLSVKLKKTSLQAARLVGGVFPVGAAIYLTQFQSSMDPNLQMFQIFVVSVALNAIVHFFLTKGHTAHMK